jgi:hypothetical protein
MQEGLVYEYDFGDSWEDIVTVEEILPADASLAAAAVCLAGSRAYPSEDCGGIGGYPRHHSGNLPVPGAEEDRQRLRW